MSNQQQKVVVSVDIFNALTNYMMERPYREVNTLLEELRQDATVMEMPQEVVEEEAPVDE